MEGNRRYNPVFLSTVPHSTSHLCGRFSEQGCDEELSEPIQRPLQGCLIDVKEVVGLLLAGVGVGAAPVRG